MSLYYFVKDKWPPFYIKDPKASSVIADKFGEISVNRRSKLRL